MLATLEAGVLVLANGVRLSLTHGESRVSLVCHACGAPRVVVEGRRVTPQADGIGDGCAR